MIATAVMRLAAERFAAPIERTGAKATLYVRVRDDGALSITVHAKSHDLEASTVVTLCGSALRAFIAESDRGPGPIPAPVVTTSRA